MTIDEIYKKLETKYEEAISLGYVPKVHQQFNQGRADGLFYAMILLTPHSEYAKEKQKTQSLRIEHIMKDFTRVTE